MKLIFLLVAIALVFSLHRLQLVSPAKLKEECKPTTFMENVVVRMRHLIGLPTPEPPWWKRTFCSWLNHGQKVYTEHMTMVLTTLILLMWRKSMRNPWIREGFTLRKRRRFKYHKVKCTPVEQLPTMACQTDNDAVFGKEVSRAKPSLDGIIFIKHGKRKGEERYKKIILGPVNTIFQAIKHVLGTYLEMINIPPNQQNWTTKMGPDGTPEFVGVATEAVRFAAVLVPGEGVNLQVQRLGPARGLIREVSYQTYWVTYRGFVLRDEGTTLLYGSG